MARYVVNPNCPINWAHPMSKALIVFVPANEWGGAPWQIISQRKCIFSNGSINWNARGLIFVLGTGPVVQVPTTGYETGQNVSYGIIFNTTAFQTSSPFISAYWQDGSTICRLGDNGSGSTATVEMVYGGSNKVFATTAIPLGVNTVAVTITPVSGGNIIQSLYVNGVFQVSQTKAYGSNPNGFPTLGHDGVTGRQPGGSLVQFCGWKRCLIAGEIASWHQAPWQFMMPPRITQYYPSAATVFPAYSAALLPAG